MADQAIADSSAVATAQSTDIYPALRGSTERIYLTPTNQRDFAFANPSTWGAGVGHGGNAIYHFRGQITATTSTAYKLTSTNSGEIVTMASSSTQSCIIGSTLAAGFNCTIIQKSAGQITFVSSGGNLRHSSDHSRTLGQYAIASVFVESSGEHYLAGDTI